ncbi:MAG: hypothetical protein V7K42_26320 [Nostoc sp.]
MIVQPGIMFDVKVPRHGWLVLEQVPGKPNLWTCRNEDEGTQRFTTQEILQYTGNR